jgi:hypothetical protein
LNQQLHRPSQGSTGPLNDGHGSSQSSTGSGSSQSSALGNDFLQQQLPHTPDASTELGAPISSEDVAGCEEAGREATVEEVLGEGFLDMNAQTEDRFWSVSGNLSAMAGDIGLQDSAEAGLIETLSGEGQEVLSDVDVLLEALMETAWMACGKAEYDHGLYDQVYDTLDDLERYIEVLDTQHAKWSIVLGLPSLEAFQSMVEVWVKILASLDTQAREAQQAAMALQELYSGHQAEYGQACMKAGVDVALLTAGIAAAALLTGPAALAAGLALTLTGVGSSLAIEGDLSDWGKTKTALNGANIGAKGLELRGVIGQLPGQLKSLGPALSAITLVMDGAEAMSEKALAQEMKLRIEALMMSSDNLLAAWPAVAINLESSSKQLARIEHAVANTIPSIDSLDQEIEVLLANLAA